MAKNSISKEFKVLGMDLGKTSFQLHGVDEHGAILVRRTLRRSQVLEFFVNLKPCLIGMEACSGSGYWARKIMGLGHTVRLMAPQFVKPYVKGNKNDKLDAEAICEAVQRPNMRFVPLKSKEQQDLQGLHRVRSLAVTHRTAQINQIRGFLQENGIVFPQGAFQVRKNLPKVLADTDNELTDWMRDLLAHLKEVLDSLDDRIAEYNATIAAISQEEEDCKLLTTIPGVGPLGATALMASVGDVSVFRSGRELAAWLGLVPRQHSTGGKARLLGISKRGDVYLRTLLVHGARAALRMAAKRDDRRSRWMIELAERRGTNVAIVAIANKNARTAWALLTRRQRFDAAYATA